VIVLGPVARSLALPACAAASLLLAACSCDDTDPWNATYIATTEAASEPGAAGPPACDFETATVAEASGARVDPNLVEIARLEVERDCYKGAEEDLRQRLRRPGAAALK
jgi:hypothetical protein